MMDVEQLHVVLQQSFSPDANLRVPAEETIRNLKHIAGSTILLLQVAAETQVSKNTHFLYAQLSALNVEFLWFISFETLKRIKMQKTDFFSYI